MREQPKRQSIELDFRVSIETIQLSLASFSTAHISRTIVLYVSSHRISIALFAIKLRDIVPGNILRRIFVVRFERMSAPRVRDGWKTGRSLGPVRDFGLD